MPPKRKTKTESTKTSTTETEDKENVPENNKKTVKDDEMKRLQEYIRSLEIENKDLREKLVKTKKQLAHNKTATTPNRARIRLSTTANTPDANKGRRNSVQSDKPKERGCACSGNCSNKKCGCVKKDLACGPSCKCSDECENQDGHGDEERDDENEDIEEEEDTPPPAAKKSVKQKPVESKKERSVFSPTSPDTKESPNQSGSNANSSYNSNVSTQTEDDEVINPMKPRRQLARSPIGNITRPPISSANNTMSNDDDDVFLAVPLVEPKKEIPPPPPELNQPEIDWEEHKKKLVKCHKCGRKFFPERVEAHEKSCLRI